MFFRSNDESSTVVRLLAEQVRRDISFGVLAPDSKLKIDELRQRYGGSANSFREALTQLANDGLVEATPQKGFRVASATTADLQDIARVLFEVESLAIRWSMAAGDVRWEGEVIAAQHRLSRIEDLVAHDAAEHAVEWEEAGRALHATLASACGSPRLLEIMQKLYQQSARFRLSRLHGQGFDPGTSQAAHARLVNAVLARDANAMHEALREIIFGWKAN
ncbi:FCD domain-containing protein [Acidovorax sp. ACV02]|uniref:GntR family transcriptional regulator n=1 Tax=Acidovorax sp. ACV02 TaxID=2769310 RepID=UPI0017814396|nr:GntR family transcriptional regulator [Acidovorax sp. ACV02]MBD9408423.1 FCD domain-containing protein [Acidovorax sp. ACV02]